MATTPNLVAAHLYRFLGEQQPVDAPDEWFLQSDPFTVDMDRIERFIRRTDQMLSELENLELDEKTQSAPQYMTLVYDAAKDVFDHDKKKIRTYFIWLYTVVMYKPDGPRWGDFIEILGVDSFCELVRRRFNEL